MSARPSLPGRRAALVVGHPGHELRVHGWMEFARPVTFVLTDGSGRTARSRLPSTTRVLTNAGATPGSVYGRFTDAQVYALLQRGEVGPLVGVLLALADALVALEPDYVVADALEGFNPSHDICRYLVNGAVALFTQRTGRVLPNFDMLLDGRPDDCPEALLPHAVRVDLDAAALDRKLAAARGYVELAGETEAALSRFGRAAFATELLRPVLDLRQGVDDMGAEAPYYERFGEQQVRAGFYESVIRYQDHVRPFVRELWRQAGVASASSAGPMVIPTSTATGRSI